MNNSKTSAPTQSVLGLARDAHSMLAQMRWTVDVTNVRCRNAVLNKLVEIRKIAEYDERCIRIEINRDGDNWCALVGENLQEGAAGFGSMPMAALRQLVIVNAVECSREISRQIKQLMHGGKLVENVAQGRAAEIAHDYSTVEGSIAAAMADAPGMPVDFTGFSADYFRGLDEAMVRAGAMTEKERVEKEIARKETPQKFWGPTHKYNVFLLIAKSFVREHVVTGSEDEFKTVVDQLVAMMDKTLTPFYAGSDRPQVAPVVQQMRLENARLVSELAKAEAAVHDLTRRNEAQREQFLVFQKESEAFRKERDQALAQLDGANSRVVAERAVAEEQSNGRETATKELIDVRARLSQAMTHNDQQRHLLETQGSTIGQLRKEVADVVAQRQTAWDELRRLHEINDCRLESVAPLAEVAIKDAGSRAASSLPSDDFFRLAAREYLKLRGDSQQSERQVDHEVVRLRDQFLRDHVLSLNYY